MDSKAPLPYGLDSEHSSDDRAHDGATRIGASQDFLDRTLEVWEPIAGTELTREDARQIAENVSRFFDILLEWDEAADSSDDSPASGEAGVAPDGRSSPE